MVRVAQDFSLRYPLVDGQGNFGSRDGDSAAAMRYTECRLTPIAELLLSRSTAAPSISSPTSTAPSSRSCCARLPFVLMNGASGIAVGMATEIPPHNLREVAAATCHLIRHPDATWPTCWRSCRLAPTSPAAASHFQPGQSATPTQRSRQPAGARPLAHREMARGQWR